MSAVPLASQFWSAPLPGGTRRLTWQDFALNRDTNTPVSAQLDIYPSGDFIARSNLVESVYRRINPDDADDDGIPDDEDQNPYAYDGDNFGPHQELPQGANTNHYYWIDIVVDHANARVTFNGDGYSHLADPDFIAKAGETNRVVLLLGKSYAIDCIMPVRVVGQEDAEISICDSGDSVEVVWPVCVDFGPRMRSGGGVGATIWPARAAGGNFSWPDNFCCYSFAADTTPIFDCDGTCGCGGCYTGDITYEIGGHSMSYGGVHCGCSHEGDLEPGGDDPSETPPDPHVSVSFSKETIVFEDEYTNSVSDVVARHSTDSELTCEVYGGTNGGHYAFALYDGGRLARKSGSNLPRSGTVAAGETFLIKIKYEAQAVSDDAGDISAVGTFTENGTGAALSSEATLTAVKVAIRPVVAREGCEFRHRMGVREQFEIIMSPQGVQHSVQCASGWQPPVTNSVLYKCPIGAALNGVSMDVAGISYAPTLTVVEPTGIICTNGYDMCAADYTAMQLDPYVTPLDVSFSGIAMMEVPTTTVGPSGYFTNEQFSSIWYHTKARGAGVWHNIRSDNYFFEDTASFAEICPLPLADGNIDWEIVLGWNERNSPNASPPIGMVSTHYHQIFTINEQGDLRIDKFGQWIKQFASGGVTNSTGIVNTGGGL